MLFRRVCLTVVGLCFSATVAMASSMHSLVAVARKYDYTYMLRNPENAVELYKPGTDIIVRPGSRVYWVNGTPSALEVAPVFHDRDVYVSDDLLRELDRIDRAGVPRDPAPSTEVLPAAQGAVTVIAVGGQGAESLAVSGTAPRNTVVTISLYGQISRDIPTVFLNTQSTVASSEGKYAKAVPIDPDYFRGTLITVKVAVPNGNVASATYVVGAPNPDANLPTADSVGEP